MTTGRPEKQEKNQQITPETEPANNPVISPLHHVKRRVKKIEALADFYSSVQKRDHIKEKDVEDTHTKMRFARKQILLLCDETRKIIRDLGSSVRRRE